MKTIVISLLTACCVWGQGNISNNLIALWTADSLSTSNGASIASVTDSVSGIVASQATSSQQPTMVVNAPGFGGHKAMRFWAANQQALDIANTLSIADKSSYSLFVVGRPATVDNGGSAAIVSVGTANQGIWSINFHAQFGYYGDQGDLGGIVGTNIPSRPTLIGMSSSGASIIFHTGEATVTGSSFSNTGTLTGGHIGSNGVQYWANMDIAEVRIYSPAIASADLTALRAYVNTTYGAAPARRVVITDGNSITDGFRLAFGEQTWPSQFADQTRSDVRVYNVAISGETTAQMITNAPTLGIPLCSQTGKAEAFLWEGTNDLTIYDAPTSFQHMMSVAALYKAGGCAVIIGTTIKAGQLTGANETARTDYNALLLGQQTYPVIDLAALSQFSNYSDTTYYNADGTHLNGAGEGVVARAVLAVLDDYGSRCSAGSMARVTLR